MSYSIKKFNNMGWDYVMIVIGRSIVHPYIADDTEPFFKNKAGSINIADEQSRSVYVSIVTRAFI
ncbi:hypothetical protein GCM10020331_044720 [Ectobacillus funiculus]